MITRLSQRLQRLCCLALILCITSASAETVRLLTVGNSFSRNATRFLKDLAEAGGHELIHRSIVVGGASLELHAEKARKHQTDSKDPAGLYSNGQSLVQELKAEPWDFVTIQQASIKSHDLSTYQPYAGRLSDIIRQYAPSARLLVHQTWAYRRDDPRFTKPSGKPGEPTSQAAMYTGLTSAYSTIAAELKAGRIPVGDAFHLADTHSSWGYVADTTFDPKQAVRPQLPNQKHSLHVGWQWKKQKDGKIKLAMDGHHANAAGEYLGACVFYEVIFGEPVVSNSFVPAGLDADYARFLRETAHTAVLQMQTQEAQRSGAAPKEKVSAARIPQ